uniref:Uncharacterized protein n=1 Tax=Caenorhabditis japonica TaxID=281687 RepID=A0A8R1HU87_CAEJA
MSKTPRHLFKTANSQKRPYSAIDEMNNTTSSAIPIIEKKVPETGIFENGYLSGSEERAEADEDARSSISTDGVFFPEPFINNVGFDGATGLLLPKRKVEERIRTAMKNQKFADYYCILEESQREGVKGTAIETALKVAAFNVIMLNEINKKVHRKQKIAPMEIRKASIGFNLSLAKSVDGCCCLPGGIRIDISSFMTPNMAANWSYNNTTDGFAKVCLETCDKIAAKDEFFLLYSSAKNAKRGHQYVPFGEDFFNRFSRVIAAGFLLEGEAVLTEIIGTCRQVISNLHDRLRASYKAENGPRAVDLVLETFKEQLSLDANFRSSQYPLVGTVVEFPETGLSIPETLERMVKLEVPV